MKTEVKSRKKLGKAADGRRRAMDSVVEQARKTYTPPPDKRPHGRPTVYSQELDEQLIKHMSQGYSFESFAGDCGVSFETVYKWAREHATFSDAKKIGRAKCLKFWEHLGIAGALGHLDGFNATSYIFNKKNRFPELYRDRQEIQQTIKIEPYIIEKRDGTAIEMGARNQSSSNDVRVIEATIK